MAKLRINGKKKNSIVKLKVVVQKLQKSLLLAKKPDDFEDVSDSTNVPEDVKEGHFAVIAVDDGENKRFVVPLSYLTHPSFSRLLEQAAEEYGFDHEGVVMVPCRPKELERMLAEQWGEETERGYMVDVWQHMMSKNRIQGMPMSLEQILNWFLSNGRGTSTELSFISLKNTLAAFVYGLWQEHNSRIFRAMAKGYTQVADGIEATIRNFLKLKKKYETIRSK